MTWWAKPSGAYGLESNEAYDNMDEIYNLLHNEWTLTAICGMLGNMFAESGFNPWRWQGDSVNYKGGYGLVQFTPARSYKDENNVNRIGYITNTEAQINGFGQNYTGYAPNLSVSEQTSGANVSDGNAQILAVNDNAGGKYTSYNRNCPYQDLSSVDTFTQYKECENLWIATVGWLWYYEAPASVNKTYEKAKIRFGYAQSCWEHFTEDPPIPPSPPKPQRQHKMSLYFYLRRL